MSAEVAAAAARGAAKGLAKNPDVTPERVSRAVTKVAGQSVAAATDAAPPAKLEQAADPSVPLAAAARAVLRGYAYVVAAAYLRRLARWIEAT